MRPREPPFLDASDRVAILPGTLVVLAGDRFLHAPSQPDHAGEVIGALGQRLAFHGRGPLRAAAGVLGAAVDVGNQRLEFLLEMDVVVRAAQPSLIAKLEEGDSAHRARLLVEEGEFVGSLADRERPRQAATDRFLLPLLRRLRLVEVHPCVILAEVEFAHLARLQLGDVEDRLLVALLALHRSLLTANRRNHSGSPAEGRPRLVGRRVVGRRIRR